MKRDLDSLTAEVVGAIKWAEALCRSDDPPPLMVIAALKTIVEMKYRRLDLKLKQQQHGPLSPEVLEGLTGAIGQAFVRAEVPDHYRVAVARELRAIARERWPELFEASEL